MAAVTFVSWLPDSTHLFLDFHLFHDKAKRTHQGNLLLHFVFVPVVDLITAIERFWLQKCKPSIFSQYCSTIHKWPLLKYCACCLTQFRHDHLYQDHHDHRRHHHDHQCHRHDHHWKMTNIKIFQMLPSKLLGRAGCLHRKYFQLGMVFNSNDCVQILWLLELALYCWSSSPSS